MALNALIKIIAFRLAAILVFLAALSVSVTPSWSQSCLPPPAIGGIPPLASTPRTGNFFTNFIQPYENLLTGGLNLGSSPYAIPMSAIAGGSAAGDLNSTYFPLYYSIANMMRWAGINGVEYYPNCPVEIVVVGTYPNARYMSITDNDAHYTATQHLADKDIDPVIQLATMTNPFVVGGTGTSPAFDGSQYYAVPVSLGTVPNASNGCTMSQFEEDNLLDATQRHYSMDWNTNLDYGSGVDLAPGVNSWLDAHTVDTPSHSNPNQGGSIVVRHYLSAPGACNGNWPSLRCSAPTTPTAFEPYIMIRDTSTGCPYNVSYLTAINPINNQPMVYQGGGLDCSLYPIPSGCLAIVSTSSDLSVCPQGDTCPATYWLDPNQQTQHTLANNITPQAAYADGHPDSSPTPQYPNNVAWVRSPQWNGTAGPDDSYVGGNLSTSDIRQLGSGAACGGSSQYGCVARFRFELPPNTPSTPCAGTPPFAARCRLNGNAALRYWSLTLWQQQPPSFTQHLHNAGPDGLASSTGAKPISIISLADAAFTATDGYVTLLVSFGANVPPALQQSSPTMGIRNGVQPETVGGMYSTWVVNGYNVVNLHAFSNFDKSVPLLMTLRNTMPSGFNCSAAAIPFFTAEYTPGGGMMGPFVPQVDFVDPTTLTSPPSSTSVLPPASACGMIPDLLPSGNGPLFLSPTTLDCGTGSNCVDWPGQTWPEDNDAVPVSPALVCCSTTPPGTPQINFVATHFPVPLDASDTTLYPASLQDCYEPFASQTSPCSQIVYQSMQWTGVPTGVLPPTPITIVGSGFGYLSNLPQMMASCGGGVSCASNYLEIKDCGSGGDTCADTGVYAWDTNNSAQCQMYIANWTDTSISVIANLPIGTTNLYSRTTLSPLDDISPLTFMPGPQNTFACAVAPTDTLVVTVTNPQNPSGTPATIAWKVYPPGTPLN
jgi:hypothetical protein